MKIANKIKVIGKIEAKGILNFVNELSEEEWDQWNLRQKVFDVHSATKSFPLSWCEEISNKQFHVKIFHQENKIWNHIQPIVYALEKKYVGECVNIMFARLLPYKSIKRHSDTSHLLKSVHRIHIPILTNENIKFYIDDVNFYLKSGYIYEINNIKCHSVVNLSNLDRVHLIIDVLPTIKNIKVNYSHK